MITGFRECPNRAIRLSGRSDVIPHLPVLRSPVSRAVIRRASCKSGVVPSQGLRLLGRGRARFLSVSFQPAENQLSATIFLAIGDVVNKWLLISAKTRKPMEKSATRSQGLWYSRAKLPSHTRTADWLSELLSHVASPTAPS